MTRRLSLAHLSAITLPPPALIEAAAETGFDAVGLRLLRVTEHSPGYPLMDEPAVMRAARAALRATRLLVSDIEFVKITPEIDIDALLPLLDAGAELGAGHLITAPYDEDLDRLADRLAALSDAAAARGIATVLEFFPWTPVPDLATCRKVVEAAGPRVGILVDSLHFDRSRSSLVDLRALAPERLPFAHLCDAPVLPAYSREQLLSTAREDRQPPGEGQIDLRAFLEALPQDLPLALEVPMPGAPTGRELIAGLRHIREAAISVLRPKATDVR